MPLSEYEQRVLAQMEQQLSSDDPKLAETFTGGSAPRKTSRVLAGVAVAALGLAVLIFGLAQSMSWLGIIGFVMMFGGVLLGMSHGRGAAPAAPQPGAPAPGPANRPRSEFMTKLDERWDKRREER